MPAIRIDTNSLANLLRTVRASTIVGLLTRTVPEMRKTDNPYFGRVEKLAHLTAVIGANYSSAVNRRRAKEATAAGRQSVNHFSSAPRTWGQRVRTPRRRGVQKKNNSPLLQHKDKFYLHLQRQKLLKFEYRNIKSGRKISADKIEPWLRTHHDGRRQGLEKPVIVRDYLLQHILQLRMKGKIYEIITPKQAVA